MSETCLQTQETLMPTDELGDFTHTTTKGFMTGSFLLLKSDLEACGTPCIWKIDGKCLLQKYIPFAHGGDTFYKSTSQYTGWSPAKQDLYCLVSVELKVSNRKEVIVRLWLQSPTKDRVSCTVEESGFARDRESCVLRISDGEGNLTVRDEYRQPPFKVVPPFFKVENVVEVGQAVRSNSPRDEASTSKANSGSMNSEHTRNVNLSVQQPKNHPRMPLYKACSERPVPKEFSNGSFLVLKDDMQLALVPAIWRIEDDTLLQKFKRVTEQGEVLYKDTKTYGGLIANIKSKYLPVKAKVVKKNRNNTFVYFDKKLNGF